MGVEGISCWNALSPGVVEKATVTSEVVVVVSIGVVVTTVVTSVVVGSGEIVSTLLVVDKVDVTEMQLGYHW